MELWPALDIKDGRCVRLRQGDFDNETVFGDPLEVAQQLALAGATRLHVVDLDAAKTGEPVNRGLVLAIARKTRLRLQVGGGVRSEQAAAQLLEGGVERVILGTAALSEDALLSALTARWPGRVAVGLDFEVEKKEVAVRGWTEKSGIYLDEALARLAGLELAGVIVTDISKDGTGDGPDVVTYGELLEATELPLVAAGGVGSLQDIARLARLTRGGRRLAGVVVGRAILSGQIALGDAEHAACRPAE
jgi:phosphoribosylformimino-5-aminoimidazole carboxamide ribotide isomerase